MASISDIAKAAGVSASTVSKALNGYSDISEATRKRILEISEQLSYTPNFLARGLALQKPSTLALIFSDVKETDNNGNIIFRLFISSVKACQQHGYELLVINTNSAQQTQKPLQALLDERRIGGAILYGFKLSDTYIRQMGEVKTPLALIDMFLPDANTFTITIDNHSAIYDMLSRVIAQNRHREIAVINGLEDAYINKIRWSAFEQACSALRIETHTIHMRNADFLEEQAYAHTTQLYRAHPGISCFFCMSDIMAIGALRALRDLGCKLPEQVAVTGFDGIQISEYVTPSLTTVYQDFKAMGHLASEALIARVNGEQTDKIIYAPYEIRIGESL